MSQTMPGLGQGTAAGRDKKKDAKKNDDGLMITVDHNNVAKSVTSPVKGSRPAPVRLMKSTKVPPVRNYPGDMRKQAQGVIKGAVYAVDIEREEELEMSRQHYQRPELTSEDLMRDSDYLKLDQSKLPLEMFDDIELQELDWTPQQWLRSSSKVMGKTPYFEGGAWVWKPCQVHGYDAEIKHFKVQFVPDGIHKTVHRLNLQFDKENEVLFFRRREVAEHARTEAKQTMRLDHFIMQQPKESVRVIRQEGIRKIHERVINGLPGTVPFPDTGTPLGNLLRSLTAEFLVFYTRTMKRTVLQAKLSGVYKDEELVGRYDQLRLPPPLPKPAVPYSGKVACAEYSYDDRFGRIENLHYSSTREVLAVHRWLHDKWDKKFQKFVFMDCKLASAASGPLTLADFRKVQSEHNEIFRQQLSKDFRRGFMDQFLDSVQDVFDFFQSNLGVYQHGSLSKLFRSLDLKLSVMLRELCLTSLKEWEELVVKNTALADLVLLHVPNVSDEASAEEKGSESPAVSHEEEKTDKELAAEAKRVRIEEALRLRTSELTFPLEQRGPLFSISLVVSNGVVELEPSPLTLEEEFIGSIGKMMEEIRLVTSIDKEVMSLLTLDSRVLYNIGVGDELCADVDAVVEKTKSVVRERISKAMERPMELVALFNEYSWIMDFSPDDYVEAILLADSTKAPHERQVEMRSELAKLENAMRKIATLSFKEENFGFVQVSTDAVKQTLISKAIELRNAIAKAILDDCRQQNMDVIGTYTDILQRIAIKPTSERELADLRTFIEQAKSRTVVEMQVIVSLVRNSLSMLESFRVPLPLDDISLSWSTLEYPAKIEHAGKEVEIQLEADKIRMMDRLSLQKDQFEKLIEQTGKDVKAAKLFSDYSEREKLVETINLLKDSIDKPN